MAADENDCGRKLRTKERKKYVDQEIDEDDIDGKRSYSLEEMLLTDRFGCEMVEKMTGPEFNMEWIQKNGLKNPIVFMDKTGLGLRVPSQNFKISDVKQCVGSRRVLDVMDVSTQKALEMTMKDWVKYFENPERTRLLNVISLEFCHTRLDNYVESPTLVRQIDWVSRAWPRHLKDCQTEATNLIQKMKYPKVQKYCLMSVAECYTDWHIDFGGTSVWYHILHGEKIFWLAPPTTKNMDTYVEWTLSAKQGDSFLGDSLEQCQRINLKAGYTFIIPSGWIHAVYTPVDSLVFGGNFLHSFNIDNQLLVSRIEEKTYVPLKFRYPFFIELMWYVLDRYLACVTGHTYLNPPDESEDAYGDTDMIHVDEDSRPPSRNPDSRPPSRTMDDTADLGKIKPESGEEAPKLSKSVTIELTRIDAALKKAQGEEDVSTAGKRPPRKAPSDALDGGMKKWVHLTAMELKGLQQIVDHLTGLLQLPVCKRGIPKDMFNAEAVLREIKQVLEDHKMDNQDLAVSGEPTIGWPESAKKKQQKLKLGYNTYKPKKGPKGKDSSNIVRRRRTRCKQCEACTRGECGECAFCKDMKKFGGPGKMKQTCVSRQCMAPVLPHSSVCLICNKEGQMNNSDDSEDISMCLMECGICWEITHPSCISSKFENIDKEGNVNEDLPNSWECPKCCNDGKRGQLKPRVKPGTGRRVKMEEWRSADSEGSQDEIQTEEELEMARSPVEGKRVVSKEGDASSRVSGKDKEPGKAGRKSPGSALSDIKVKSESWSGGSSPSSTPDDWHQRKRNSAGGMATPNPSPIKDIKKAVKKERNSAPNSPSHQQTDDSGRSSRKRPTPSANGGGSKNGGGCSLNGYKEDNPSSVQLTPTAAIKRPKREGYGGDGMWVADGDASSRESDLEPYVTMKHPKMSPSGKDQFYSGDRGGNADMNSSSSSSSMLYPTSSFSPVSQPLSECSMYNPGVAGSSSNLLPPGGNPHFNIADLKQEYPSTTTPHSSQDYPYDPSLREGGSNCTDIKPFSAFLEYQNTSSEKLRWGTDYTPKVPVKNYVVRPPPPPHIPDIVFMNKDIPHPLTRPLWTLIFSYLSQSDLARLSSVCRTFDCWALDPSLWPELNLSRISIKQQHLKGIVLRQPRSLKLASSVISHAQLLWLMARLPGLKHLDLSNLSWASICALCFADCPLLQSLHLNWATGIRDLCFRELASPPLNLKPGQKNISRLCRLERLSLTGTDITDQSLETLATHLPKLVALDLTCCMRVTDRGIRALVQLGAPCHLQDIRLVKCVQLTERCLDSLASCRELRFLALTDIPAISQEACVRFSRNYKHRILRAHAHGRIVPIKACAEGLKAEKSGHFGNLFQALHMNRIVKTDCFDEHCPSLNQPDAKGMTKLQKRTCSRCGKYHSSIKHKNAHMRVCFKQTTDSGHSESRVSESESELNEEVGTLESDPGLADRNIFEHISSMWGY